MAQWQRWAGIMKCYPFEEKRLMKWEPPFLVQPKYDGDRMRNVGNEQFSLLVSSEENIVYSLPHINEELDRAGLAACPLDGEAYSHPLCLEGGRELIHSIFSRTVNLHSRREELGFMVFDLKKPGSQLERLNKLIKLESQFPKHVKLAPFWICNTLDEIKKVYDNLIKQKYEGIIVRNIFNIYEEKRSTLIMKFKPKKADIYQIKGYKEETTMAGEPKGRLGSVLLTSQSGDEFSVSAGLDDNEKEQLWKVRENLPGAWAVVFYQHLTNKKIPKGTFDLAIHSTYNDAEEWLRKQKGYDKLNANRHL